MTELEAIHWLPKIDFTPMVEGKWSLIQGNKGLKFQKNSPWAKSAEYSITVPEIAAGVEEIPMGKIFSFKFRTPGASLVEMWPPMNTQNNGIKMRLNPIFWAKFDQKISPKVCFETFFFYLFTWFFFKKKKIRMWLQSFFSMQT